MSAVIRILSLLLIVLAQMMVGGCDSYDDGRLEMKQYEGKHYEICTPEDMFLVKKNLEEKKLKKNKCEEKIFNTFAT